VPAELCLRDITLIIIIIIIIILMMIIIIIIIIIIIMTIIIIDTYIIWKERLEVDPSVLHEWFCLGLNAGPYSAI